METPAQTGNHMDLDQTWQHIHRERLALAEALATLTPEQWAHPSACTGWTVHDVAAHVIAHPQITWAQAPGMFGRNLGRGYNGMIAREVKRRGARETPESILADFATYDGSRRHAPLTRPADALLDVVVHTQDILRPLGLEHTPDPEAAVAATERAIQRARLVGWRKARGHRFVATDVDWSHGTGTTLEGPIGELLLHVTGREARLD